tara:strand:- start:203 stop:880 length:678 start_codon:yes stop_codon:yes gene_type:complete
MSLVDRLTLQAYSSARIERKFPIHPGQEIWLLRPIYRAGFVKAYPNREVTSIYFDTQSLSFCMDNINGVRDRIKFRYRFYNDSLLNGVLEAKLKKGFIGFKKSYSVLDGLTIKFFGSDIKLIDTDQIAHFIRDKFQIILRPASTVSYQRSYFEHPGGMRLTMDKNISSFPCSRIGRGSIRCSQNPVMEIKYPPELDSYIRMSIFPFFESLSIRATKSSKYVNSII